MLEAATEADAAVLRGARQVARAARGRARLGARKHTHKTHGPAAVGLGARTAQRLPCLPFFACFHVFYLYLHIKV